MGHKYRSAIGALVAAACVAAVQQAGPAGADVAGRTSLAWTGFIADLPPGPSIQTVEGTFDIPALKCPRLGSSGVSIWIGLGVGDPGSGSPRVGVTGLCKAGLATYTAWTQWVDPEGATRREPIPGFTPDAGGRMRVDLEYFGWGHVLTEPELVTASGVRQESYLNLDQPEGAAPLKGASVGCVVERPSDAYGRLPLANFGTIRWQRCSSWDDYYQAGVSSPTQNFGLSSGSQYDEYENPESGSAFTSDDLTMRTSDGRTLAESTFSREPIADQDYNTDDDAKKAGSFIVTWKASDSAVERAQRLCTTVLAGGGDTVCSVVSSLEIGAPA